ncbi:cell envelope biogenesis protein TolA [Bradyrhizobium oligotrophicum]|uniref:cell envelope biogenesis protein TolA n=1 Tax=Bradyrhizobium oligotrophicum TaxID=44255 RepID=UPI003EBDDE2D
MMYDLATFPFWILLAALIGGFVGWQTWSNAPQPDWSRSWLLPTTLAIAIGLMMALLSVLPGRAGLWLEVGLLMVGAYVLGCLFGGHLKDFFGLGSTSAMSPGGPANSVAFVAGMAGTRPADRSPAAQAAASIEADRRAAEAAARAEAERLATEAAAKAEADRLAAEAAAKAEADRLASEAAAKAEADRLAEEAAAKAEADRLAAEAAAKAEADRLAAEAAAKAEDDRLAAEAAAKAEADRLAAEAAAKAEADRLAAEAAAKVEADRLAAEAAAKAEAEAQRLAAEATAKDEADRLAAEAAAKAEADRLAAEATAKAEAERLAADAEADRLAAEVAASSAPPAMAVADDDRPPALPAPDGTADDLKLIKGIGPNNERVLNDIGVHHFSQIAAWSPAHADWVGHHMAFPGRIEREHWIAQARLLAAGLDTAHSTAVKSGAITIDDQADAPLSEDEANDLGAQLPALMPKVENEEAHAGTRPLGLAAPRGGQADDLKLIKGIGKQNEARLHGLGIWHFDQIAAWTTEHAKWVGSYLAFAGRIEREQWIGQARELANGGTTEFAKRVEAGLVTSSLDDGSRGQDNVESVQPRE